MDVRRLHRPPLQPLSLSQQHLGAQGPRVTQTHRNHERLPFLGDYSAFELFRVNMESERGKWRGGLRGDGGQSREDWGDTFFSILRFYSPKKCFRWWGSHCWCVWEEQADQELRARGLGTARRPPGQ